MINYANINHLWSSLLIDELVRSGVEYFCIAPGSRSTPLTVAAARHPKAKSFVHFDERALAFHALGYACAHKKPVVLICTSGTAGANFYPAIIEASKKKVPLIVLTADRPPELRHTGSVQTIDQVGLFGKYVKFQFDMPSPDVKIKPEFVLTTVDQAVYHAKRNPSGVVHLNCMFRDPLAPVRTGENFKSYLKGVNDWIKGDQPFTQYVHASDGLKSSQVLSGSVIETAVRRIEKIKNGLIVVGKIGASEGDAVVALAKKLGWPVFADVTSGLRLGKRDGEIIHYFDQILSSKKFASKLKFDGVIHLGGRLTSKRYYEFVDQLSLNEYIMVLNHPLRNDPGHQVTLRFESQVKSFCEAITKNMNSRKPGALLHVLTQANKLANAVIEKNVTAEGELNGIRTARLISQLIPADSGLFLGNSMPVRDVDFFADYEGPSVLIHGNRGASGIDGNVASAIGLSVGLEKPVTLFIGDLALLHDLNSLSMTKGLKQPVVIVVINNDGGAIFSFLPISNAKDIFEKYFTTPHGLSFESVATMFNLNYARPKTTQEFTRAYKDAFQSGSSYLIEITTDNDSHVKTYKDIQAQLAKVLTA